MFERLVKELRKTGSPADQAYANVIASMRVSRGADIPLPNGETSEAKMEVRKFSPEARKALEMRGFVIYTLRGKSLRQLREEGNRFWTNWHQSCEFDGRSSEACEVAIKPGELFLKGSGKKTSLEQENIISDYSEKLSAEIKGVQAIIGEADQYAEFAFVYVGVTHKKLFERRNIRTKTKVGSRLILVDFGEYGLGVSRCDPEDRNVNFPVFPLVVPAQS